MKTLHVVPLSSDVGIEALEKMVDVVGFQFSRRYEKIVIERKIPFLREEFPSYFEEARSDLPQSPHPHPHYGLKAPLGSAVPPTVFSFLQEKFYNIPVVAVTDYPLLHNGISDGLMGIAGWIRKKAIVSRSFILFQKESNRFLTGLMLHELGHLSDLEHHVARTSSGRYCPMISGRNLSELHHSDVLRPEYLQEMDQEQFCTSCINAL